MKLNVLIITLILLAVSIHFSSSAKFIISKETLMSVLKNEANKLPKLKHTDKWYEVMANAIYKSFKKFSELKVFDPIQLKIKHKVVSNSVIRCTTSTQRTALRTTISWDNLKMSYYSSSEPDFI